jgi:hypothetical protein
MEIPYKSPSGFIQSPSIILKSIGQPKFDQS